MELIGQRKQSHPKHYGVVHLCGTEHVNCIEMLDFLERERERKKKKDMHNWRESPPVFAADVHVLSRQTGSSVPSEDSAGTTPPVESAFLHPP